MTIKAYAKLLEELARQFEERKITYQEYIEACNALGEVNITGG